MAVLIGHPGIGPGICRGAQKTSAPHGQLYDSDLEGHTPFPLALLGPGFGRQCSWDADSSLSCFLFSFTHFKSFSRLLLNKDDIKDSCHKLIFPGEEPCSCCSFFP